MVMVTATLETREQEKRLIYSGFTFSGSFSAFKTPPQLDENRKHLTVEDKLLLHHNFSV